MVVMNNNPYQFDQPVDPWDQQTQDTASSAPAKTRLSGMAIASLILSAIFCIPVLPQILGIVLGVTSLSKMQNPSSALRGLGLALAAVIVGVTVLFGQTCLGLITWQGATKALDQTATLLRALESGSLADCKKSLTLGAATHMQEQDVNRIQKELDDRLGHFTSCSLDWSGNAVTLRGSNNHLTTFHRAELPVKLKFSKATAYAMVTFEPQPTGDMAVVDINIYTNDGLFIKIPPNK